MPVRLEEVSVSGFRSVRDLRTLRPGNLTVMVGGSGSGKSNLLNFFLMLNFMMNDSLQSFVAYNGGASRILHHGNTPANEIDVSLTLSTEKGMNDYECKLTLHEERTFMVALERQRFRTNDGDKSGRWQEMNKPSRETHLGAGSASHRMVLKGLLLKIVPHHFHDIAMAIRSTEKAAREESRYLRTDGANLGQLLYRIREQLPERFERIEDVIEDALPFFDGFVFDPNGRTQTVRWREKGRPGAYDAMQAGAGMLRLMGIVTLLLYHTDEQAVPILIDDVETGLDARAQEVVALLMKEVSEKGRQIFVATKSPAFARFFHEHQILGVNRTENESLYQYLRE